MPKQSKSNYDLSRPGMSPTDKMQEMISDATALASRQLKDGTAKAQIITHYLQLGSPKTTLELEILQAQKTLLEAKTEALKANSRNEELFTKAIEAMRDYKGGGRSNDD